MKFWTTGRIDEQIEFDIFQPVMIEIEKRINEVILGKDYGDGIGSYDVIINIFKRTPQERFRYSPKSKETDIDVNIDHDRFLCSDHKDCCKLYLAAVLHSIDGIRNNKHLKKFDFDSFRKDVSSQIEKYD